MADRARASERTPRLAHEAAADGVTVNTIAPGYTETELTRPYLAGPVLVVDGGRTLV